MKAYSTMGHIHSISQVIEKSAEYNKPLELTFLEYEKALDSVKMKELRDQAVDEAYMRLLGDIYKNSTGTMILYKQREKFPIKKGVRHADTMSPKLFTTCLESVFRKLDREK